MTTIPLPNSYVEMQCIFLNFGKDLYSTANVLLKDGSYLDVETNLSPLFPFSNRETYNKVLHQHARIRKSDLDDEFTEIQVVEPIQIRGIEKNNPKLGTLFASMRDNNDNKRHYPNSQVIIYHIALNKSDNHNVVGFNVPYCGSIQHMQSKYYDEYDTYNLYVTLKNQIVPIVPNA